MTDQTNELPPLPQRELDALLDHIYEYGTIAEGIRERALKLCEAYARAALASRQVPVAWRYKKPVCKDDGSLLGYSGWTLCATEDFLEGWPHEPLYAASPSSPSTGEEPAGGSNDLKLALHQLHQLAAHFHGTNADGGQCDLAMTFLSQFDEDGNRPVISSPSADARALLEAKELLRIWQTYLGPTRRQCDEAGKALWDRIEAVCAPASKENPHV